MKTNQSWTKNWHHAIASVWIGSQIMSRSDFRMKFSTKKFWWIFRRYRSTRDLLFDPPLYFFIFFTYFFIFLHIYHLFPHISHSPHISSDFFKSQRQEGGGGSWWYADFRLPPCRSIFFSSPMFYNSSEFLEIFPISRGRAGFVIRGSRIYPRVKFKRGGGVP